MMIAIPKRFELGGRTWTVELTANCPGEDDKTYGLCEPVECRIYIKAGMSQDATQHTFYHELCHALCFTLGWDKLNDDEGKIDALGSLLYQFLKKKKGRVV
jgi:hypothetical protein